MKVYHNTTKRIFLASWVSINQTQENAPASQMHRPSAKPHFDIFQSIRRWLDNVPIRDRQLAHRLCKLIPSQCPFERDVKLLGKTLFHIPPMCKLNPVYEELVSLRFRALCYLADECGEDVTQYC
ncbi:Mo-dependent nitrogenase C-terminal domain-containing protein [Brasilonema sp. UFV-L1]|uniref:Mo-dependent nitrogenase C-terminal domain-containing protein n=1 Tax=Brasilonema sp. UFV-L1 TaxID=2234130 RepID=UPI00145E8308|nr:Mo-dependent nitrogenase C-terminal domain-containing protein [Brasilonema sp. UFV-L1]NMG06267.1 nitrogenase [Brasilonema sp. UFV-L1]